MVDGLLKSFDEFGNGCDEKLRYIATVTELSALSDGGQQHKSAHILVIRRARAKKIEILNHLPTCVPTSE